MNNMEDNPREMELNFECGNEQQLEELAAVRDELSCVVYSGADGANNMVESIPEAEAAVAVEEPVEEPEKNKNFSTFSQDTEVLLRSRYPVNRPGGTPPLNGGTVHNQVTALETAIAGKSYGIALRILREQHNISYKELEQITCIQPRFLAALENENLEDLPAVVYVIAFVRTLCRFYKLSEATSNAMVKELKAHLEYSCNDELMNTLDIDRSGAAVNEQRLKKILMFITGTVIVFIALIVLLVVMLTSKGDNTASSAQTEKSVPPTAETAANGEVKFDPDSRYLLLEAPVMELPKLPVAQ